MEKEKIKAEIHTIIKDIIEGRLTYQELGCTYEQLRGLVPRNYKIGTHVLLQRSFDQEKIASEKYGEIDGEALDIALQEARVYKKYLSAFYKIIGYPFRIDFEKMKAAIKVDDLDTFVENVKKASNTTMTVRNKNHPCYGLIIPSGDNKKYDSISPDSRRTAVDRQIRQSDVNIRYLEIKKLKDIKSRRVQEDGPLDILEIGKVVGAEIKERALINGGVVEYLEWSDKSLQKIGGAVKTVALEGRPIEVLGNTSATVLSAITHACYPRSVIVHLPQSEKKVTIPQLAQGKIDVEGNAEFKMTENGQDVLIEYSLPEEYDESNIPNIIVPEVDRTKSVYIKGDGPNYLTAAIAESYAQNDTVSIFQPGAGYVCSITNYRNRHVGDIMNNPIEQEKMINKKDLEEQAIK